MTDHSASVCAKLLARAEAERDRLAEELRKCERDYRAVLEERDAARREVERLKAALRRIVATIETPEPVGPLPETLACLIAKDALKEPDGYTQAQEAT